MKLRKLITKILGAVCLLSILPSSAYATTLVSGYLAGNAGYWFGTYQKGYTFINNKEKDVPISGFTFLDSIASFSGKTPTSLYANWMTNGSTNGYQLTAGKVDFYSGTELILSLAAKPLSGAISMTPAVGVAGDFTLNGLYDVVGGSIANRFTGPLSFNLNYDIGKIYNGADFHFYGGSFSLSSSGGGTAVPEPASSVLLISSLAGIAARRRKKA